MIIDKLTVYSTGSCTFVVPFCYHIDVLVYSTLDRKTSVKADIVCSHVFQHQKAPVPITKSLLFLPVLVDCYSRLDGGVSGVWLENLREDGCR